MPAEPEVGRSRQDGMSVRTWAGAAGWGPGSRCDKEGPWAAGGGAAEPCPALKAPAAFRDVHFARSMCHLPPEQPLRFGTVLPICFTCRGRMPCVNVRVAFLCGCCLARQPGSAEVGRSFAGDQVESAHHLSPWSPCLQGHEDHRRAVPQVTARCHKHPYWGWDLSGHLNHPTAPKGFLKLV